MKKLTALLLLSCAASGPAFASDESNCRDWARDALAVGRIIVPELATANDGVLRTKSQALYLLCMNGAEIAQPNDGVDYEVYQDEEPAAKPQKAPAKPAAKGGSKPKPKPKPAPKQEAWIKECAKFKSWNAKTETVVTWDSDPERVRCPHAPPLKK